MSRSARFRDRLESSGRVHLDARVLAVHLLADPRYLELTRLLFRAVRKPDVRAQTSTISLYQLLAEPYRSARPDAADRVWECLTAMRSLEIRPVSAGVARRAAQVRARLGGRPERALQIATALEDSADLFVTRNSGLRRIAGTGVLDMDDFARPGVGSREDVAPAG